MAWMNVPFPPRLAYGLECDPEWEVRIASTISGFESRNLDWSNAKHRYDASFAIRSATDHQEIREHFHMARGPFHTWPLLDPLDHDVLVTQGVATDSDEASDAAFQLCKQYGTGGFAYKRKITRPLPGALIYVGGVLKTEGVDYTLDDETGLLVYPNTDVVAADITWSGQFYVPCRYDTTKLPVRIQTRGGAGMEYMVSSEGIPICEVRE